MSFKSHQCQNCGSEEKLVDTSIYDRFVWNADTKEYEPQGFEDEFEHTGDEICAECEAEWTGK